VPVGRGCRARGCTPAADRAGGGGGPCGRAGYGSSGGSCGGFSCRVGARVAEGGVVPVRRVRGRDLRPPCPGRRRCARPRSRSWSGVAGAWWGAFGGRVGGDLQAAAGVVPVAGPIGLAGGFPAGGLFGVVVVAAQRAAVADVGVPAVVPRDRMIGVAAQGGPVAAGGGAGVVQREGGVAQPAGRDAGLAADADDAAAVGDDEADLDAGVGQPAGSVGVEVHGAAGEGGEQLRWQVGVAEQGVELGAEQQLDRPPRPAGCPPAVPSPAPSSPVPGPAGSLTAVVVAVAAGVRSRRQDARPAFGGRGG
jgi:hypothetical protein